MITQASSIHYILKATCALIFTSVAATSPLLKAESDNYWLAGMAERNGNDWTKSANWSKGIMPSSGESVTIRSNMVLPAFFTQDQGSSKSSARADWMMAVLSGSSEDVTVREILLGVTASNRNFEVKFPIPVVGTEIELKVEVKSQGGLRIEDGASFTVTENLNAGGELGSIGWVEVSGRNGAKQSQLTAEVLNIGGGGVFSADPFSLTIAGIPVTNNSFSDPDSFAQQFLRELTVNLRNVNVVGEPLANAIDAARIWITEKAMGLDHLLKDGYYGTTKGSVTISNGAALSTQTTNLGIQPSAVGSLEITGAGSTWVNAGTLMVGNAGNATILVKDKASVQNSGLAQIAVGNTLDRGKYPVKAGVTVDGSGTSWVNTADVSVGYRGQGALTIRNGAKFTIDKEAAVLHLGQMRTGHGTLVLNGGTLVANTVRQGDGAAQIILEGNSTTQNNLNADIAGRDITLLQSGGNTVLTGALLFSGKVGVDGGTLRLGTEGAGTLDIRGGTISIGNGRTWGKLAAAAVTSSSSGGKGLLQFNGGLGDTGADFTFVPKITGDLNVEKRSDNVVTLGGSEYSYTGSTHVLEGRLVVHDMWNATTGAITLGIKDYLSHAVLDLAYTGDLSVSRPITMHPTTQLWHSGSGTTTLLSPVNTGTVNRTAKLLAKNGTLKVHTDLLSMPQIGVAGGDLEIGSGYSVGFQQLTIAGDSALSLLGTMKGEQVDIRSGELSVSGAGAELRAARMGLNGLVTVDDGGQLLFQDPTEPSNGRVQGYGQIHLSGAGSRMQAGLIVLNVTDHLHGNREIEQAPLLLVEDQARLDVRSSIRLGALDGQDDYSAVLQIGSGAAAGIVSADRIAGQGFVIFNHNEANYEFSTALVEAIRVKQIGTGTTTLLGGHYTSGSTLVSKGTLQINGNVYGSGEIIVEEGATLGGIGSTTQTVVVNRGGTIAPGNSPGSLTLGGLVLDEASFLTFEVGSGTADTDHLVIEGDVVLNGILNIEGDRSSLADLSLISYTGTLTDLDLEIGETNVGDLNRANLSLSMVDGRVTLAEDLSVVIQHWNGVDGDVWNDLETHWTQSGTPGVWQEAVGVFGGPAGMTVSLGGNVAFDELQFITDGYELVGAGGSLLLEVGRENEIWVGYQKGATISSPIAGDGGLLKSGLGTLILEGSNSFTGGVLIDTGILSVASDASLGAAGGALTFDGGVLKTTASFNLDREVTLDIGGYLMPDAGTTLVATRVISGEGALGVVGEGTVVLQEENRYQGGTRLDGGVLSVSRDANLGNAAGQLAFDGGTLHTSASLATSRDMTLEEEGGTLDVAAATTLTHNGLINGEGALTKRGGGTLLLNHSHSFEGGANLLEGTLLAGAENVLGAGAVQTAAGATWDFAGFNQSVASLAGAGTVEMGGGTLMLLGSLNDTEFSGAIHGTGGLVIEQSGLTLSGVNSYTGGTVVRKGSVLSISQDVNLGASSGAVTLDEAILTIAGSFTTNRAFTLGAGHGEFEIEGTGTLLSRGEISGAGALIKSGTGTLRLEGGSSHAGGTLISEGALAMETDDGMHGALFVEEEGVFDLNGHSQTLEFIEGGGTVALGSGATLTLSGSATDRFDAYLTGTGHLILSGARLTFLTGPNDYLGTTTIRDGAAAVVAFDDAFGNADNAVTLDHGTLVILDDLETERPFILQAGGGAFEIAAGAAMEHFGTLDGSGSLTKAGRGSLILYHPSFYLGDTIVLDGTLAVRGDDALPETTRLILKGRGIADLGGTTATLRGLEMEGDSRLKLTGGRLTLTDGTVNVANGRGTVRGGSLFVDGDFRKGGDGLLSVHSRVITNQRALIQEGGVHLGFNGAIWAERGVFVGSSAVLGGGGLVGANLMNRGEVIPGSDLGLLVRGDYRQSRSGALQINVRGYGDHGKLRIHEGTAYLDGKLRIVEQNGFRLQHGRKIAGFLRAETIRGSFDEIVMPSGFRHRLLQSDGKLSLLTAVESYTQLAANRNQYNVAKALDGFIPATSGDRYKVSLELDWLNPEEIGAAFEAISPALYGTMATVSLDLINHQGNLLQQRFRAVQLGGRGLSVSNLSLPIVSGKSTTAKETNDFFEPTPENRWGTWLQASGVFSDVSRIHDLPDYRTRKGGLLGGVDYRWNDTFTTGLYTGYQAAEAKYGNDEKISLDGASFGGYASYGAATGFFTNVMAGGGVTSYTVKRSIEFGDLERTARNELSGGEFESLLNLGYNWQVGNFNMGPVATMQYTYLHIGGSTETGAESLNLDIKDQNVHSLRSLLGAQIAYIWQVAPEIAVIPQSSLYWQHEYMEIPGTISAALDGGRGRSFDYHPGSESRDALYAGAGATVLFGRQWSANVYYNAKVVERDNVSHQISAGIGFQW